MNLSTLFTLGFVLASAACGGKTIGDEEHLTTSIGGGSSIETTTGGSSSTVATAFVATGGQSAQSTTWSTVSESTGGQSSATSTTTTSAGGALTEKKIPVYAIGKNAAVLNIDLLFGYETPKTQVIVPPDGVYFSDNGVSFINFAISSKGANLIRVTGARVCQTDPNATAADFTRLSISWASTEILVSNGSAVNACWNLVSTGADFPLYQGDGKLIWLNAVVAQPVGSIASDARTDVPLSGHTPVLTITEMHFRSFATATAWDDYNVVMKQPSNQMVVRAAKAGLLQASVPDTVLKDGQELVIHRNEIATVHAVDVKHFEVSLQKTGNYAVHSFKVYRSDPSFTQLMEIPSDQVQVNVWTDMQHGVMSSVPADAFGALLYVEFAHAETIASQEFGRRYVITAKTDGVVRGDTLSTSFWESNQTDATGSIGDMSYGQYTLHTTFDSVGGRILWSDRSVTPHNDLPNGSADWINDGNVWSGRIDEGPVQLSAP